MNLKHLLTKLNPFAKKVEPINPEIEEVVDSVIEEPKEELTVPKKNNVPHKISEQDKQYMVTCLAGGMSPTEVARLVEHERGIQVSHQNIYMYGQAEKWQPLMRKIRQELMSDLAAISGSHKKVRLERAEKVYDKAIDKGKLDIALKATEHQRKEMEGDNTNLSLTLNQFNVLSDDELEHKKKQVMERIKLMTTNTVNVKGETT